MANITKQFLIQEIAKSTGFVRNDIKIVVEQFLDLLGEKLIEGNTIEIRGFGTFACKPRKARPARNPRTGETVLIDERLVPTFKFSNDIKDKINSLEGILGEATVQPELETENEIAQINSDYDSI
ncbi:MAG: integration host factor subunit beta [Fibrobacter sp.]|uniref:HU family DNA-binding protein n=1 Tax=Fibrobacter sp. TaxID=35828 RepID=UPI0015671D24|nr:HU family DNA-binding protein [Fibrobacter sp.]MBQ7078373.1 integration host factor subunit beta [Fibrobacter sp.]